MSIELKVNGKKVRFSASAGWYPGEQFKLLAFSLFEREYDTLYLVSFTLIKLNFEVHVDFGEEL